MGIPSVPITLRLSLKTSGPHLSRSEGNGKEREAAVPQATALWTAETQPPCRVALPRQEAAGTKARRQMVPEYYPICSQQFWAIPFGKR